MVEEAWLDEGDTIVPQVFVDNHMDGKCISTQKVKDKINTKIENANSIEDPDSRLCVVTYLLSLKKELFGDEK